ncbi:Hypothetical predicted protein [Paramuricea clavata]|uniref:Uncharacterized protein n=1 Tax=Paramuricea clavata TaxID=317549 RepID=A0A6S7HRJ8_PARCT|nr:Hypothetical predicted protein [Paramuricea clavata]
MGDGIVTEYLYINREAACLQDWAEENRMPLNLEKTYEMVVRRHTSVVLPELIPSIKQKTRLKLLGVTLQDNPCNWDLHFEEMFKKASGRMYIMRVCKYYGLSIKQLDLLFDSLIMSIFTIAIELWGCAYDGKYLNQIDKFVKRAHKNGYISKRTHIKEIRDKRDKKLWNKITSTEDNALLELLPEKRTNTGGDDDFKTAVEKLTEYFMPKKNLEYEIYIFRQARQTTDETLDQYHTRIRKLATTYEFTDADREIKHKSYKAAFLRVFGEKRFVIQRLL